MDGRVREWVRYFIYFFFSICGREQKTEPKDLPLRVGMSLIVLLVFVFFLTRNCCGGWLLNWSLNDHLFIYFYKLRAHKNKSTQKANEETLQKDFASINTTGYIKVEIHLEKKSY